MTHIVTDGKYLIADKRTTFSAGNHKRHQSDPGSNRREFRRDDSVKLYLPTSKILLSNTAEDDTANRIKLVTLSGTVPVGGGHPIKILASLGSLYEYRRFLNSSVFANQSFTLLVVTENNSVTTLNREMTDDGCMWRMHTHSSSRFTNGGYLAMGSGSQYNRSLIDAAFKEKKITLLDLFLYGSHLDPGCSTDYSVYGFHENHLYTTVRPDEEMVSAAYNKVLDLFKFKGLKRSYTLFSDAD